jgi:ribonucleoside-diphosphate reductase alpha chain
MSSCYLLTVGEDSLEGIYKSLADCAKLSKFSGGIGIDWTPVRASGALIRGTNGKSNGIIPFLKVFDSSVHAVNQGGKRKGAAAVYLETWHADIEAFLDLRNNTGSEDRRTHHLNLALWISDLFMKRVEEDKQWSLFSPDQVPELHKSFGAEFEEHYHRYEEQGKALKTVSARQLYARMMQTLAETGNGWICFKDKANLRSAQTAKAGNVIHSSNLCTEILEVTTSSETAVCNLGSVNLASFITSNRQFDFKKLQSVVETAVTFLDRVVDINFYPTTEAKTSNHKWRPVGLGIMGLQDALFKMRIPFTSEAGQKMSAQISEAVYYHALKRSMALAQEKGRFDAFEASRYTEAKLQVQLAAQHQAPGQKMPELNFDWETLARDIARNGLRNSLLIAIAPTATIASIVGSFESIEPQVSNLFKRETLSGEFLQVNRYLIADLKKMGMWNAAMRSKILEADGSIQNITELPEEVRALYKTAWEISQKDLIEMAAARSAFICQSQSLNLFMESPSVGKLSSMYMYAWKQGLKTTYYLRSRAKTAIQKTTTSGSIETATAAPTDTAGTPMSFAPTPTAQAAPQSQSQPQDAAQASLFTATEAVVCSLENPAACEACQ